jgi:prepilin-type N-terminal cleavage/methylation domain-containing protein
MERQQRERQRIATGDWRLVEQRSMFATRYSPLATRHLPRYSPFATRRRYAFTLTELLTVIAIIAILMGLLVTFYRPSQEQRKVFECQNHLQVIHRALRLYMLDWEGFPASPYDTLNNDKDSIPGSGVGLFDEDSTDGVDAQVGGLLALSSYLRSQRMLLCPSDPNAAGGSTLSDYSSYQGCDTGTGFVPGSRPDAGANLPSRHPYLRDHPLPARYRLPSIRARRR